MTISIKPTASGSTIEQDGSTVLSVESDRSVDIDSGTLHVDATNNRVGIGESNPNAELHITDSAANAVIRLESANTGNGTINFDDQSATNQGRLVYDHSNNSMQFYTVGTESMRIDSSGNVGIAETNPELTLEVDRSFGTIVVTVADDAVATIPAPKTMGFLSVVSRPDNATPAQDTLGFIAYDCGTSKQIQFAIGSYTGGQGTLSKTSINLYNTTNLTGTTGPDTDVNISCYTDFNIQLENRLGYSATFALTFL